MRKSIYLALFVATFLVAFTSFSQGCKVYTPYSIQVLLNGNISVDEIIRNAAIYDSIMLAEQLRYAPEDTIDGWKRWDTVENLTFGKNRGDIPMIADPLSLHPYFRDKVLQLIQACRKKGIELAYVETYRTHTKQDEYKNMGKRYTSSGAGKSKHQYGLAVDVVPIVKGEAQWNNMALWRKIGITGEQLGLRWGGRWKYPFDPGHFEWSGGLSGDELAQGAEPQIPKKEELLYPCLEEDLKILKKYWAALENYQSSMVRNNSSTQPSPAGAMK